MDKYMVKKQLIALLYPTRCPICSEIIFPHEDFCSDCREKLPVYKDSFSVKYADGAVAAFYYDKFISSAVVLMKRGIKGNVPYAFGIALAKCLKERNISEKVDIIVPVPMHKSVIEQRGFNQSELIANEVGRILGIQTDCVHLEKRIKTIAQKELPRHEREKNLRNVFTLTDTDYFKGKRVLVIDDVSTTGSTFSEIARLLKECGASAVYCACCCKTEKNKGDNYE